MKFLSFVLVLFVSSSSLATSLFPRRDVLELKSNRPGLQVAIFNNSEAPKPRCMCATFSALVREGSQPMGATRVESIQVVVRDGLKTVSKTTIEDSNSLFRCPGSPWYSDQSVIMKTVSPETKRTTIEVSALAKKCLNPTEKACQKLVVVAKQKFTVQDLYSLNSKTPMEALEVLKSKDKAARSDCGQ